MSMYIRVSDTGSVLELIQQEGLDEAFYAGLLEVETPSGFELDHTDWTYVDGVFDSTAKPTGKGVVERQNDTIKQLKDDIAVLKAALNL